MPRQTLCFALGALTLAASLAVPAIPALAAEPEGPAGSVKAITGLAQLARHGAAPTPLRPGERIFENDVLTTGAASSLGLILRDNSTVSLGPGSRLVVERFLFAPEKGALASVLRVAKGSAACVTGEIAKLSPESVKLMTPTATIGIRGTHFLVNVDDGPGTETDTTPGAQPGTSEGR
jgi:hypothetical protein